MSGDRPLPRWLATALGPLAGGAGAAVLLGLLGVAAPGSTLWFGHAEGLAGRGYAAEAAAAYASIGVTSSDVELRREALQRAAWVYELELAQRDEARRMIDLRLALGATPEQVAALREELAELWLGDRELAAAAQQYELAHRALPSGERAPLLLARAAELRTSLDQPQAARALWRTLMREHPEHAALANLGLGELALAEGRPASALSPFQHAARSGDAGIADAARMGLAACYERLGELDGALAELDQAALPEPVRERRKSALRQRATVRASGGEAGGR